MQSRKRGIHIIGTVQIFKRLDDTLRRIVEWKVKCKRIGPAKHPKEFIYKYVNNQTGQKFYKRWPAFEAQKCYADYDTYQPINPQLIKK